MYKIYINDKPLMLQPFSQYDAGTATHLSAVYMNKPVTLLQYIDTLEKNNKLDAIHLYGRDFEKLVKDFLSLYQILDAAGGVVVDGQGHILAIFRRGHWDLPKGKVDKGETLEEAAVREVMEETGINEVALGDKLCMTYHTYISKQGQRILKRSHWYRMAAPQQPLVPQAEEDIERAVWIDPQRFLSDCKPAYPSIHDVVLNFLDQ